MWAWIFLWGQKLDFGSSSLAKGCFWFWGDDLGEGVSFPRREWDAHAGSLTRARSNTNFPSPPPETLYCHTLTLTIAHGFPAPIDI